MTITEIEKAIEELSLRHDDLTKESLLTLLLSAGWEKRTIDEALLVYETMRSLPKGASPQVAKSTPEVSPDEHVSTLLSTTEPQERTPYMQVEEVRPQTTTIALHEKSSSELAPVQKEETPPPLITQQTTQPLQQTGGETITFLLPDGTEEKPPTIPSEPQEPVVREEPKKSDTAKQEEWSFFRDTDKLPQQETVLVETESVPQKVAPVQEVVSSEKQSVTNMAVHQEVANTVQSRKSVLHGGEIPSNLPIVPFEISHDTIWTFDKYKDAFHKEEQVTSAPLGYAEVTTDMLAQTNDTVTTQVHTASPENSDHPHHVVEFEKTPITRTDESLVILASIMLLAIILILGYMYGQGRL